MSPQRPRKRAADIAAAQDPDALLTVNTVAQLTGFAAGTVRQWARNHRYDFPEPERRGRNVRWRAGEVRDWLQRQGIKPAEA